MPKYVGMPSSPVISGASVGPEPTSHEPLASVTPIDLSGVMAFAALAPAGYLGDRESIERELDAISAQIRFFHLKQPDQVMRECSAYSARLTELAVLLHRAETSSRHYVRIRTQQVDRFLDELERQYKTASRLVEISRQDLDLMKGT